MRRVKKRTMRLLALALSLGMLFGSAVAPSWDMTAYAMEYQTDAEIETDLDAKDVSSGDVSEAPDVSSDTYSVPNESTAVEEDGKQESGSDGMDTEASVQQGSDSADMPSEEVVEEEPDETTEENGMVDEDSDQGTDTDVATPAESGEVSEQPDTDVARIEEVTQETEPFEKEEGVYSLSFCVEGSGKVLVFVDDNTMDTAVPVKGLNREEPFVFALISEEDTEIMNLICDGGDVTQVADGYSIQNVTTDAVILTIETIRKEPVTDEIPPEVQAFLDAVAELPEANDVTVSNAEAVGEQLYSAVLSDGYALISDSDASWRDRYDVIAACAKYEAVFAAVESALALWQSTFAGNNTNSLFGQDYHIYDSTIVDELCGKNLGLSYELETGETFIDEGVFRIWVVSHGSGIYNVSSWDDFYIWSTNESVLKVTAVPDGKSLKIVYEGVADGTAEVKMAFNLTIASTGEGGNWGSGNIGRAVCDDCTVGTVTVTGESDDSSTFPDYPDCSNLDITVRIGCYTADGDPRWGANKDCYYVSADLSAEKNINGWYCSDIRKNNGELDTGAALDRYPYACTLTLKDEYWVKVFNDVLVNNHISKPTHYLHPLNVTDSMVLLYNAELDVWQYDTEVLWVAVIESELDADVEYTVIYTDGVYGEIVFVDQGYGGLLEGDPTPPFVDENNKPTIPVREGYDFMGWAPAVQDKVSPDDANSDGKIIYTATWEMHQHTWSVATGPDCIHPGEKICSCGEKESIPALGHDFTDVSWTDNREGGHTDDCESTDHVRICKRCDGTLKDGKEFQTANHDFGEWESVKEPSCVNPGVEERQCQFCDHKESREVKPLGHDFDGVEWKDDTPSGVHEEGCGSTEHYRDCKRCSGKEDGGTERSLHPYGDWERIKEPDCVTPGFEKRYCQDCDHEEQRQVDMLGHDLVDDPEEDPDCIHEGLTAGSYCVRCDYVETKQSVVPALGHDFTDVFWKDNCEGGHTEDCDSEDHIRVCRRCEGLLKDGKESETEAHKWSEWSIVKEPTCIEDGLQERHCNVCEHEESESILAKGHVPVTDEAVEPDCIYEGRTEGSHCEVCGAVLAGQKVISALGHDFEDVGWLDNDGNGHTDDCTTDQHMRICKRCGGTLTDGKEIQREAHIFEAWVTVKEPSCTENGLRERHCQKCDHVESEPVPVKGHAWIIDEGTEPDCIHSGHSKSRHCDVCGLLDEESRDLPALGHDFANVAWEDDNNGYGHIDDCVSVAHVRVCRRCNGALVDGKEAQRAYHRYGEWVVMRQPTYSEEGLQERRCADCDHREQILIPVLIQETPVPTPAPEPEDTPDETPEETSAPTVEPTPVPAPVPVPTYHPEPVADPEDSVELEPGDDPVMEVVKEQPEPEPETELGDELIPMDEGVRGRGAAWALVNFALMNLAVFESVMLLVGYFVQTKKQKKKEDDKKDYDDCSEDKELKKHGIIRVLSIVVAVVSVIAFILTEDITLPTGFVDKWTLLMLIIAVVQTIVVVFSRKEEKPGYQVEILDSAECEVTAEPSRDIEPGAEVILSVVMREDGCTFAGYEVRDGGNHIVTVEDGKFCMPESDVTVRVLVIRNNQ